MPTMTSYPSGGCIRFDTDGPYLHENYNHGGNAITSVAIDSDGYLDLRHRLPAAKEDTKIACILVSPDETLTSRGITAGASGGSGQTRIRFYSTKLGRVLYLNKPADYELVVGNVSNVWVGWTHMVTT